MGPATMTSDILRIDHLTVRFGGLTAVNDLNFSVRRGEITGLIGPNGAGKTTVFNCITGFYKPTTGLLTLTHPGGNPYYLDRMADFRVTSRARVARTFQNIRLFSGMTVLENLLVAQHNVLMKASGMSVFGVFGLPVYSKAEKLAIEKARYWIEKVGLSDRADDPAGELPYGAQRRLEIARAMCTDPLLLCLDEPAAGLNPRESADLNTLLMSIRKDNDTSILLIEHDMSVVMQVSDHVVVLEYGRKISDGTPSEVKADPRVIAAYLGVDDSEIEQKPEVAALIAEAEDVDVDDLPAMLEAAQAKRSRGFGKPAPKSKPAPAAGEEPPPAPTAKSKPRPAPMPKATLRRAPTPSPKAGPGKSGPTEKGGKK
jgi:branched-chain amino acid transport system ATP-binding protein